MEMKKIIESASVEQTLEIAEEFAKNMVGGETVLLCGDLGAGKTHFVKGLALGLGIDDVITSPTFALHNQYFGRLELNHFDFYRVEDSAEVEMLGLNEYFCRENALCAIEWSQNVADLLPQKTIRVTVERIGDQQRRITIEE